MEPNLLIHYDHREDKVILTLKGRLDSLSADLLDEALERAKNQSRFVEVNMAEVDFMSSLGIRSILLAYKHLKTKKGELKIISPSSQVKNVIGLVNLNMMLAK